MKIRRDESILMLTFLGGECAHELMHNEGEDVKHMDQKTDVQPEELSGPLVSAPTVI